MEEVESGGREEEGKEEQEEKERLQEEDPSTGTLADLELHLLLLPSLCSQLLSLSPAEAV